jgi:hypothetical protein
MKAEGRRQKAEMGRRYLSRNVASRPHDKAESRKQKAEILQRGLLRSAASRPQTDPATICPDQLARRISAFCFLLFDL